MLAVSSRPTTRIARRCLSLTAPTRNGQSHSCLILLGKPGADCLRSSLISVPAARRTVVRLVLVRCVPSPPSQQVSSLSSVCPPKLTMRNPIPIFSRPPPPPQQLPVLLPRPLLGGPTRPQRQARPGAEADQRVQSGSSRRFFVRFPFFRFLPVSALSSSSLLRRAVNGRIVESKRRTRRPDSRPLLTFAHKRPR